MPKVPDPEEEPEYAVGPHEFWPLRATRNAGRCRLCYHAEELHPITGWVKARPPRGKW